MGLRKYKEKRHFNETPEPKGKVEKAKDKLRFVIQRHEASRLHYDFRLEADGVLKSWAVPKGPSLNSADRRLAVMVEDHPTAYGSFTGDIPAGNYGAGHVEIWDNGTYEPEDEKRQPITEKEFLQHLEKGSIKFRMHGTYLKGSFALVKMKGRGENNWLLIKHKDEYAISDVYDIESLPPISVKKKKAASKKAMATKKTPAKKATKAPAKTAAKKAVKKKPIQKATH